MRIRIQRSVHSIPVQSYSFFFFEGNRPSFIDHSGIKGYKTVLGFATTRHDGQY
jgi:hypothetical protein